MTSKHPKIVLVGRENVGKSTLFNRLIESNKAIVSNIAGTTRDRNYEEALWRGKYITFIDTAGYNIDPQNIIKDKALKQFKKAIKEADLILFLVDAQTALVPEDQKIAKLLYKIKKPKILVINKADNKILKENNFSFEKLDFKHRIAVSATNGTGTGDLLDLILELLNKKENLNFESKEIKNKIKISFIGQANVGKSSIINAILNEERVIASNLEYTTRENNRIDFQYKEKNFELIDTAGIRKKIKNNLLEKKSVEKSKQSLKQADIIVLVLDASKEIKKQDIHLAGLIADAHKGIIIAINKWDLVKNKDVYTINEEEKKIRNYFKFIKWAKIIFISAQKRQRIYNILDNAIEIQKNRNKKINNHKLYLLIKEILAKNPPQYINNPKIKALEQIDINPPTFLLVAKYPKKIHFSYLRHIENQIRKRYDFSGTAIRFIKKALK